MEVRRQFKLGVLEGKVKPDYAQAVDISTTAAQKELVSLALLGIVTPIVVGLLLQVEALGGFLAGIIVSGQLLAVFLNNSGGAWDNAKKLIEDEPRDLENNTGKGSERHKAGVVGDTVGDPFKDTAGPALNPMIKVVNLVSSSLRRSLCSIPEQPVLHGDYCLGCGACPCSACSPGQSCAPRRLPLPSLAGWKRVCLKQESKKK